MKTRMKTNDVAFAFRMGAGFPGDVNRTHPASIEPCLIDVNAPVTAFGQAALIDPATQGVRPFAVGDQDNAVTKGYGITVRPYPFQQSSGSNYGAAAIGEGAPPLSGVVDVLRAGYIMSKLNAGVAVKGNPVYVWCAASAGAHVLGGLEADYSAGNTTQLKNATFNGGADASGNVEIAFNI